ncbi:MAG: UDP-N-acetylmuramoyl-tripeptide--D-alanyl-D-alanine ligase [Micrococcales bacterium]
MITLSVAEITQLVAGQLVGSPEVEVFGSVETDSRLVGAGSLFVCKPGEVTDGHNFAESAVAAGAVALLVERELAGLTVPQIVVADSVLALGLLAKGVLARVRAESGLRVVGITGSNGKTTTKNMLRAILSQVGPTIAPIESYNNEVGAPISVLKVDRETAFLVAELGAGGPGSIAYLTDIVQPDIAVELKVGLAHAGEFGGIETTARIKAELLKGSPETTLAVLNADDVYVREMAAEFAGPKVWFGTGPDAQYRADSYALTLAGTAFDLHWPDSSVNRVTLQILGEHHVMNALASAAVADALGVDRTLIVSALEAIPLAERWRMQLTNRPDGIAVINDAYNASPDSSRAALQTLAQLGRLTGRRTVAVLGEMAELGDFSREEHDKLGRLAVRLNIDQVVAVGPAAKLIHMGASFEGSYDGESQYFESLDEALTAVRGMLRTGDIVLVKSSKSANLRHLGDALLEVNA